jgi:hypothetical protein
MLRTGQSNWKLIWLDSFRIRWLNKGERDMKEPLVGLGSHGQPLTLVECDQSRYRDAHAHVA